MGGAITGMMICNDRRWPESWRVLGLQGVELACVGYNSAAYDPDGGSTEDSALLVADCDLDLCRQGKSKMFNLGAHRQPAPYGPITEWAGVVEPG